MNVGATLRAEWTKLRTMPGTGWALLAVVVLTIGAAAVMTAGVNATGCPPAGDGCPEDVPELSLSGVYFGQIAVLVLAARVMTAEYGTGLIHVTLAASPRRGMVLAAKALVVTAATLLVSAPAVLGALLVARILLPGSGFTAANGYPALSLADPGTRRAAVGTVLYLGLIALLSVGAGAVARDSAGAMTTLLSLLYAFPILSVIANDSAWLRAFERWGPMNAGLAIQSTVRLHLRPIGPWEGLGVLAGYAAAALVAGYLVFRVRDA